MQINVLSLNTWSDCFEAGQIQTYLKKYAGYDVFCLQEVHAPLWSNTPRLLLPKDPKGRLGPINTHLVPELKKAFQETHEMCFTPQIKGMHDLQAHDGVEYGNAVLVKKGCSHKIVGEIIFKNPNMFFTTDRPSQKSMQVITLYLGDTVLIIGNVHGFWHPNKKRDCPERAEQSRNIAAFLQAKRQEIVKSIDTHMLLVGDLNYRSDTEALRMLVRDSCFGKNGGVHLNHKWRITDTRTQHYPSDSETREADHAIASPELTVSKFWVDPDSPSDHKALHLALEV